MILNPVWRIDMVSDNVVLETEERNELTDFEPGQF